MIPQQISLLQLNKQIKDTLEQKFNRPLWVVAEIAQIQENSSGHCYLELIEKDTNSNQVLARNRATIWAWQYRNLKPFFEQNTQQRLCAGLKVLVAVNVQFHEVYSFSLNITDIDPNYTMGDLARQRMETLNRLKKEGLLTLNKQIELPELIKTIAIISSPTAAGYGDFMDQLNNNSDGFAFHTKLFDASMQGDTAPPSIMEALNAVYEYEDVFDLVVIIRGGGAQMDLNCFDNYHLAAHIAQFPLPVLTGIGHEKDDSIADMVAHTKLKTPTAVAEYIINSAAERAYEISKLAQNFINSTKGFIDNERDRLNNILSIFQPVVRVHTQKLNETLNQHQTAIAHAVENRLEGEKNKQLHLHEQFSNQVMLFLHDQKNSIEKLSGEVGYAYKLQHQLNNSKLDEIQTKLKRRSKRMIEKQEEQIKLFERTTKLVDPQNVLNRGYSITLLDGKAIKDTTKINDGTQIETILKDGRMISTVKK